MSELKLGKLIDASFQRDAVHVAICPVMATVMMKPGQSAYLVDKGKVGDELSVESGEKPVGKIDPFLEYPVYPGQWCWLWLKPGSITSLRHEWTHPILDGDP